MTVLTVGPGQQHATLAAALAAAGGGDTLRVQAGTYIDDFVRITADITLQAVGGMVTLLADTAPPDGQAILTAGGPGVSVEIDGFAITNRLGGEIDGLRCTGGTLALSNMHVHGNRNGLVADDDPQGVVTVINSEFGLNGSPDGTANSITIGHVQTFTLAESYVHETTAGHHVQSRAESSTFATVRIFDLASDAAYSIDLPNGGDLTVTGCVVEQGENCGNPILIAYGEAGDCHPGTAVTVAGNIFVNRKGFGPAMWNRNAAATVEFADNTLCGIKAAAALRGPATQAGTTVLSDAPELDMMPPFFVARQPPPEA